DAASIRRWLTIVIDNTEGDTVSPKVKRPSGKFRVAIRPSLYPGYLDWNDRGEKQQSGHDD
ncbi:hypothetical protein K0M31_017701, partial [Melipona bicolor]